MATIIPTTDIPLTQLHQAMTEAYSDYVVPMNISEAAFGSMLGGRSYDAESSRALLIDGQIAAFWLIGRNDLTERGTHYCISVGTLPDFRRRGLSEQIFATLHSKAQESGVRKFVLECITTNDRALAAYKKLGFVVRRHVVVSRGPYERFSASSSDVTLRDVSLAEAKSISMQIGDWQPTWQNSFASFEANLSDALFLVAEVQGHAVGLCGVLRATGQIKQLCLVGDERRSQLGEHLLSHVGDLLGKKESGVYVNIDGSDLAVLDLLKRRGWEHYTSQYEMVYTLGKETP